MNKNRLTVRILLFMLIIALVSVGCRPAEKPAPDNIVQEQDEIDRYIEEENIRRRNDKEYQQVVKAESIADTLVDQEGIYDATVVLYNGNALVGVDTLKESEEKISKETKDRIINTVKSFDTEIKNVTITSDKNLFNKIDDIEQSLIKGDRNRNISREIDAIIKKIK